MFRALLATFALFGFLIDDARAQAAWRVETRTAEMDGEIRTTASRAAARAITDSLGRTSTPRLYVRCSRLPNQIGRVRVFVGFGSELFTSFGDNRVRIRLDDGDVRSQNWARSDTGGALFAPDDALAGAIRDGRTLHMEFSPPLNSAQYTQFDLAGSSAAIGRVLAACTLQGEERQRFDDRTHLTLREAWLTSLRDARLGSGTPYAPLYARLHAEGVIDGPRLDYSNAQLRPISTEALVDALFAYMARESICVVPGYAEQCPTIYRLKASAASFLHRQETSAFANPTWIDSAPPASPPEQSAP